MSTPDALEPTIAVLMRPVPEEEKDVQLVDGDGHVITHNGRAVAFVSGFSDGFLLASWPGLHACLARLYQAVGAVHGAHGTPAEVRAAVHELNAAMELSRKVVSSLNEVIRAAAAEDVLAGATQPPPPGVS